MNSFNMFLGFALIAAASVHALPSGFEVKVHHEYHPQEHHEYHPQEHHEEYVHSEPQAVEAHHGGGGGGEESHGHAEDHHDYYHHPAYKYEYGVKDPKTGDSHSAWEHRDGDKVVGEYSLDEADGTKRVVKYTSDKHSGFQAKVERIGHAHHIHHDHGHQEHGHHY